MWMRVVDLCGDLTTLWNEYPPGPACRLTGWLQARRFCLPAAPRTSMCGSGQYRRGSPPPPPLTSPPKLPGRKCIVPPKGRNIYHQPCIQLEQILGEMRQMVMTGMPLQHSSNDMHCTGKSWNQSSRPIEWYRASFSSVVKGVLPDCYGPSAFLNGSQDNITSRTARRIPHIDILPLPGMPPSRASGRGAPPSRWWWRPC